MHIGDVVNNGKKRFLSQKFNSLNVTRPLSLIICTAFLYQPTQIRIDKNSLFRVSRLVLDLNKVGRRFADVLSPIYHLVSMLYQRFTNVYCWR